MALYGVACISRLRVEGVERHPWHSIRLRCLAAEDRIPAGNLGSELALGHHMAVDGAGRFATALGELEGATSMISTDTIHRLPLDLDVILAIVVESHFQYSKLRDQVAGTTAAPGTQFVP